MNLQPARLVLAVLVTPLLPALAFGIVGWSSPDASARDAAAFLVRGLVGYGYSLAFLCVLGLPAFLVARRLLRDRWWVALLAGAAVSLAACAMLRLHPLSSLFVVVGAGSGVLFRALATSHAARHGAPADAPHDPGSDRT